MTTKTKKGERFYEVEDELREYKLYKAKLENLKEHYDYLNNNSGVSGISYDGVNSSATYKISSLTEDTAMGISEEKEYTKQQIKRLEYKINAIERTLKALEKIEMEVLKQFYIENLKWNMITYNINVGRNKAIEIRDEAITKVAELLPWISFKDTKF